MSGITGASKRVSGELLDFENAGPPEWDEIVDPESEEDRRELFAVVEPLVVLRAEIYLRARVRGMTNFDASVHANQMLAATAFMLGAVAERRGLLRGE